LSKRALIELPPTSFDKRVAHDVSGRVTPRFERAMGVVTWLADEKVVLTASVLGWAYCRLVCRKPEAVRSADHVVLCVAAAGLLPHLFKRLVNRERPNRKIFFGWLRGIPRQGNPYDSFPSGHAIHLAALVAPLRRVGPRGLRPYLWPAAASLAMTRVMLLAHYPTDVAAGLAIGAGLEAAIAQLSRAPTGAAPAAPSYEPERVTGTVTGTSS
jgi:membrane-associated phospholipid phosphatase